MSRWIHVFGDGKADGGAADKELLGGKGANLAEMTRLGIPVPPGFTVSTAACAEVLANKGRWPEGLADEIRAGLRHIEAATGRRFGDPEHPLLVSVRSGAAVSMPGMMDTILNLGLSDATLAGLAGAEHGRFAADSYRRLVQMLGDVVLEIDHALFERELTQVKADVGAKLDTELSEADLQRLVRRYKAIVLQETGKPFPEDPIEQLSLAISAVFDSWNTTRAVKYRQLNDIHGLAGTAVNVQAMVFGNRGENSATGVCFTRDPSTGENAFYGEFLQNAQGEDVVAGIRTPLPIEGIDEILPGMLAQLLSVKERLENHYKDMQDIEFTVENGELYMLQTRAGKRTGAAAVRIAVDMVKEGLLDEREALWRIQPSALDQLLHPTFDPSAPRNVAARGLPASPGAATGRVVFSAAAAEEHAARNEAVILVRNETSPEDIGGMHASRGILTARGGMTSHAAVVARGMGTCCVAGCNELIIDADGGGARLGDSRLEIGDWLSLDGSTGEVMLGRVPTVEPELSGDFAQVMHWSDEVRRMRVRTNADTPQDAQRAREFGAEGIGLCRTEHMFFGEDRIAAVRRMILADSPRQRQAALDELLPLQRSDFEGIFSAMAGLPVTVRLLDPPLHEFLPHEEALQAELARSLGWETSAVKARVAELSELNPMLGKRGCRLGLTFPEIYDMQVRAIFEAAGRCASAGIEVKPEIMIPLVGARTELAALRERILADEPALRESSGFQGDVLIGTMIEVPRAALTAGEIAEVADFFSFGTNDLTQMGLGLSRDDTGPIIASYIAAGLYERDPFASLDQAGVGRLVDIACREGRAARPELKIGVCGEHGGDPRSIQFFERCELAYVSCSPFRVPIARLAAAQAFMQAEADAGR
ncbi:MAG: pyruvate, phosphate dikinase [Planctomycetota bacterium]|nr:MAG: pyruvate, phosphate dikinase [Planctomycetota bacterium]